MDKPGFGRRMFEREKRKESLAQAGRWEARWALQRLQRTPKNTGQRVVAWVLGYAATTVEMARVSICRDGRIAEHHGCSVDGGKVVEGRGCSGN